MYDKSLKLLQRKGIALEKGLNSDEFSSIEQIYQITFPLPLKGFLSETLPVSKGFYNWRDFSDENVAYIKSIMHKPYENIYDMAEEVYWCDGWGEMPQDIDVIGKEVRMRLSQAPLLIPIYAHRYMPIANLNHYPIISAHDTDFVYYGDNLQNYFEIEFGDLKQEDLSFEKMEYIPFWTDLM